MTVRCECCGEVRELYKKAGMWLCEVCRDCYDRTGEVSV